MSGNALWREIEVDNGTHSSPNESPFQYVSTISFFFCFRVACVHSSARHCSAHMQPRARVRLCMTLDSIIRHHHLICA